MIGIISQFNNVLKKFKFSEPVPNNVQEHCIRNQKTSLIKVIEEKGKYNLLLKYSLKVFFTAKKMGIRVTIVQSAGAILTILALTTSGISAASYIAIKNILNNPDNIQNNNLPTANSTQPIQNVPSLEKKITVPSFSILKTEKSNRLEKIVSRSSKYENKLANNRQETDSNKYKIDESKNHNKKDRKKGNDNSKITTNKTEATSSKTGLEKNASIEEKKEIKEPFIFFGGASISYNIPIGSFSKTLNNGISLNLSSGLKNLFIKNFNPRIDTGFYYFSGKTDSSNKASLIPIILCLQYQYNIQKKYYVAPELDIGLALYGTQINDLQEDGISLITGTSVALGYTFNSNLNVYFSPGYYNALLEEENLNYISLKIGTEKSF